MQLDYDELKDQVESDLSYLAFKHSNKQENLKQSVYYLTRCLSLLKRHLIANGFTSIEEEIFFFKEIKPKVYGKLLYYRKALKIESWLSSICRKNKKKYLQSELNRINYFYQENFEFCRYLQNNLTYLDDKYFVRNNTELCIYDDSIDYSTDREFSTSYDFIAARYFANEMLTPYIGNALSEIKIRGNSTTDLSIMSDKSLVWTDSKISLVEVIYGLYSSGSINNGKAGIKEIAAIFERIFNIEIGDCYRPHCARKIFRGMLPLLIDHKVLLVKSFSVF